MRSVRLAVAAFVLTACANSVLSVPVTLTYTGPMPAAANKVHIDRTPVGPNPRNVRAVAQQYTLRPQSGPSISIVAFCLDLAKYAGSGGFVTTPTPFTNSFGLSAIQFGRVQTVFNANYGAVSENLATLAPAFQLALWEAAFEKDTNKLSLRSGTFRAFSGIGGAIQSTAAGFLTKTGGPGYKLTFLQSGDGSKRSHPLQNLVTAAVVPLPAAIWLLLGSLGGIAAVRRWGRQAA